MEWLELTCHLISWPLMVAGGVFLLIGAVGLLRFPDIWSRLHAASIVDTLGAGLFLLGLVFQAGFSGTSLKLVMIGFFLFLTTPTAAHVLANAVFGAGIRPKVGTKKPDLGK